jgi:hypothetical protein
VARVCARCDEPATTVAITFSVFSAYLDACPQHLADLLDDARPVEPVAGSALALSTRGKLGKTRDIRPSRPTNRLQSNRQSAGSGGP